VRRGRYADGVLVALPDLIIVLPSSSSLIGAKLTTVNKNVVSLHRDRVSIPVKLQLLSHFLKKLMRLKLYAIGGLLSVLTLSVSGCSPTSLGALDPCDASFRKGVALFTVLHPGSQEFFSLATPAASNDCEAHYDFTFSWANSDTERQNNQEPPLNDLTYSFSPGVLLYFPHPPPKLDSTITSYFWTISFSIGNKNTSLPSTQYMVSTDLDNAQATHPWDSVYVGCTINYTPFH
jgi:hypothetical protein